MEKDYPEEKKAEVKALLRRLLAADDVVRAKYIKGELSRKEASRLGGNIAVVVDGIVLEALRVEKLGEAIAPVLLDKVENGLGNPLPYTHFLQMLAFWHQLEIGDRTPDPNDVNRSIDTLREEIDLENIVEQKKELAEDAKEEVKKFRAKWDDNQMFG